MKRFAKLLAASAAMVTGACSVVAYSAPGSASGTFERTLGVSGPVHVDVRTPSGDIDVRSADTDQVTIRAAVTVTNSLFDSRPSEEILRAIERNPPIEQSGGRIRIGGDSDRRDRRRVAIRYQLVVPRRAALSSKTGSGALHVRDLAGAIRLETGSGDIDLAGTRADVRAESGSGAIRLADGREGHLELSTGSGPIDARGVRGPLRARSGSGAVVVAGEPIERWELRSGSGHVVARIPAQAGFDVSARTGSGRVRVPETFSATGERRRGVAHGRIGAGGPVLDLTTGSGDIDIE